MRFLIWTRMAFALLMLSVTSNFERARAVTASYTGGTYTQDFDTLPNSGTPQPLAWSNDTSLPGWEIYRLPAPGTANTTIRYDAGTSNAGGFYSYGEASGADRALGSIGSNSAPGGWYAVGLTNNTAEMIDSVTVEFDYEQWRNGGNATAHTLVTEYGLGDTFLTVATWTAPGGNFDTVSPIATATSAAVNGNVEGLIANRGGALTSLGWTAGATLWVRWLETNEGGNDHGHGIDNFSLTSGVEEPTGNADFDGVGGVNGTDFLLWQRGLGTGTALGDGDADGNGSVDNADLTIWKGQYPQSTSVPAVGAVPEPGSFSLAGAALAGILAVVRRRVRR